MPISKLNDIKAGLGLFHQLHSHRLFSSWRFVFLYLFLPPAFLAADGQWSDAAADGMFDFAEETVGSEGATDIGVAPNAFLCRFVAGDFLERGGPLAGRHLGAPGGEVEKRGARIGSRTVQCGGITVERRARPGVFPCVLHHPRADGITLDVAQGLVRMRIVHSARVETVLPEVTGPAVHAVDVLRVEEVRPPSPFNHTRF